MCVCYGARRRACHGVLTMTPTPQQIKEARANAGLTQSAAATVARVTLRTWQKYEGGEVSISPAVWELFLIKSGQHDTYAKVASRQP